MQNINKLSLQGYLKKDLFLMIFSLKNNPS